MGIFDFLNPPAANIPLPQMQSYNPTGQGQAEYGALGGIGNLGNFNTYGQYLPQARDITQQLISGNPGAGGFQLGSNVAGGMGQQGAMGAFNQGQGLYNMAPQLFGMGGAIANTAFDPQNALYARTIQQLQDQTRAGQAARGIGTTPYGAGLENQAMSNFNIDWQNQQLQRQINGGQAAGGLFGQGAGLIGQGAALQAGAPGQYYTASSMPYNAANTIGTNQFGALSNLGGFGQQASNIPQQQITDWQNYLGWGTGQQNANNQGSQNAFSDALNRDKQAFSQQGSMFGGIGQALGAIAPFALAPFTGGASLALGGMGGLSGMFGGGGNPSSAAYGSNPFTPYGTINPAYG